LIIHAGPRLREKKLAPTFGQRRVHI
jgi:hypothetical protein